MIRYAEGLGIICFTAGWLGWAWILRESPWLCLLGPLPLAYFLADLFSGLVHWVCDSFGSSATPVWGPMLVKAFREHHYHPQNITRIDLRENLGASAIAGFIVLAALSPLLLQSRPSSSWQFFGWWLGLWFLLFAFLSNLLHRWAHFPYGRRPAWMKRLQKLKLILDSESHGLHHLKPHRRNYCILCGWANSVTNRIPWAALEKALAQVGVRTNFD